MRSRRVDTSGKRYAVVSCHVERPLDDHVWAAFARVQERRPGGFAVAALLRPPDVTAGEDERVWLERAHACAGRGPLGHHTHWTSPTHARPTTETGDPGARVLHEGRRLREHGVEATLFCGGGWYTDASVAAACAALGYSDCTPRARRPPSLDGDAAWAELAAPARLRLASRRVLVAVPTTHSVGDLVRALSRPGGLAGELVHVYFHDTDLLDARRRLVLMAALRLLALRRTPARLDDVAADAASRAPELDWTAVARRGAGPAPQ